MGEDREQGLTLRRAADADAGQIADLVRLAFSTQSVETTPPPSALKETPSTIARELSIGGGAVVMEREAMVGAVLWREEERSPLEDNRRLFLACGFVDAEFLTHEGFSEPTWVRMERTLD